MAGVSERGTAYRIEDGSASRAWVDTNGERLALRSTATEGSLSHTFATGGTLVIAVSAGKGWQAWADGATLTARGRLARPCRICGPRGGIGRVVRV